MENETEIIESLSAVGYTGKLSTPEILTEIIEKGPREGNFRELIKWITNEIHFMRKTDEKVGGAETDFNSFMLELSAFLKEIACPYDEFISVPLTSRFPTKESRILLFDYLLTELMASKMCHRLDPKSSTENSSSYVIPVDETSTAIALQDLTKELNLGKPPENISPKILFEKLLVKLDEAIKRTDPKILSKPLFVAAQNLSDTQWEKLDKLYKELDQEYNLRRQMLLTRLEVTIQSFQWSEKMKTRGDEIMKKYHTKSTELEKLSHGGIDTDIAALLAARADMAIIEKTSSGDVRLNTASKVQKHVIGRVPDRGGRAYEHAPPPPEMPSWQQNRSTGPSGGGASGGRGGGSANRGGNWNQQQNQGNYGGQQRQQYDQRQQFDQRQQYNQYGQGQQQQYSQRQQYGGQGQQQQPQQQQQYNQPYGQRQDNQWQSGGGGGRVQGGWSQKGSDKPYNQRSGNDRNDGGGYYNSGKAGGNDNYYGSNQGSNNYGQNYQNQGYGGGGSSGGDYRSQRGKSNYNRGGGGGGRR